MPRPEKVQAVEDIRSRIESAQATFLTEYRGLNVSQQQQLRRNLRSSGTEYKIVKMTLARLAAGELGIEGAEEWLTGPTALAFAGGDPVETAKALRDFAREHEQLVVKAGFLGGRLLLPEQVSKLADVEPRPVLLAKLAGGFQAPLAQAAGLFAALTRNTASVVSQLLEKRASQAEDGSRKTEDEPAVAVPEATAGAEPEPEVASVPKPVAAAEPEVEPAEVMEESGAAVEPEPEAVAEPEAAAEPEVEATTEVSAEPEAEAEPVAAAEEDTNNEPPAEPAEEE